MFEDRTNELPVLLETTAGTAIQTQGQWEERRAEFLQNILDLEYGQLPAAPEKVKAVNLIQYHDKDLNMALVEQYRIELNCDGKDFYFNLRLLIPEERLNQAGKVPVIIDGDTCWYALDNDIRREALKRGFALLEFNRLEFAADNNEFKNGGIAPLFPKGKFGSISAWAWGYHRCVDYVQTDSRLDKERIIATGHSRGGKTALLAGITDKRIALVNPNASGCCGCGSFTVRGEDSERLENIVGTFPYWFTPDFAQYAGKESELPFDQNATVALMAPRPLLITAGTGDLWANPLGTYQCYLSAREVFALYGAKDAIAIHYREGGHAHTLEDWNVLLDFAEQHLNQ